MFIQNYEFNDARDFMSFISPWNKVFRGYIFRGHSDENYKLLPVSLREDEFEKVYSFLSPTTISPQEHKDSEKSLAMCELRIIREFYKLSDSYGLHVPVSPEIRRELSQINGDNLQHFTNNFTNFEWLPENLWEIAALTQHYGLPTRLLDWTYDPFIAAYFASCSVKNSSKTERLCIWALNKEIIGSVKKQSKESELIHFITPHYSDNPNINAQKGLFTLFPERIRFTSSDEPNRTPLDQRIKPYIKEDIYNNQDIFVKITLPKSEAPSLFDLLSLSGYGTARLFPGYEGVAEQILRKSGC